MALAVKKNDFEHISAERPVEFRTLTGTSEEIVNELGKKRKILAVVSSDEDALQALIEAFELLAPSLNRLVEEQQSQALVNMFKVLLPPMAPTPEMLEEARMKLAARQAVLNSEVWLTAVQLSEAAGFSDSNPSQQPNKWKKSGAIFAINSNGTDYFPYYALDPLTNFRPTRGLKQVLEVLRQDGRDDWGVAFWFASHNGFLDGKRPQDLLLSAPERVLDAAREEVVGIMHG